MDTTPPPSIAARAAAMFSSSAPQLPHRSHKTNPQFVATPHILPSGKTKIKVDEVKPVTRQQKAFFPAFLFFPILRTLSVALLFVAITLHKPFIDLLPRSNSKLNSTITTQVPKGIFGGQGISTVPSTRPNNDHFQDFTLYKPSGIYNNDPQHTTEPIVKDLQVTIENINEMGSNMTLVDKANAIAAEFEYTPQQVRDGVNEYLRLMGERISGWILREAY